MIRNNMVWSTYHTRGITEKYLYKFISKENADLFFESGSIWFSRADIFGDKMECVLIPELQNEKRDYEKLKNRQRKFLISCWYLADNETVAHWDSHAKTPKDRKNIAIRFKRSDLLAYMKYYLIRNSQNFNFQTEFTFGRIAYKNLTGKPAKDLVKDMVLEPAFRKEAAFDYEKEFRFVIKLKKEYPEEGFAYRLDDANKLPFKIIINPMLDVDIYKSLNEEVLQGPFSKKLILSQLANWVKPELF